MQSSIAMNQGAVTCTDLGLKHAYSFEATGTDLGTGQVAAAGRVTLNAPAESPRAQLLGAAQE